MEVIFFFKNCFKIISLPTSWQGFQTPDSVQTPPLPALIHFSPQGGRGGGDRLRVWSLDQAGTGGPLPPQLTSAS